MIEIHASKPFPYWCADENDMNESVNFFFISIKVRYTVDSLIENIRKIMRECNKTLSH